MSYYQLGLQIQAWLPCGEVGETNRKWALVDPGGTPAPLQWVQLAFICVSRWEGGVYGLGTREKGRFRSFGWDPRVCAVLLSETGIETQSSSAHIVSPPLAYRSARDHSLAIALVLTMAGVHLEKAGMATQPTRGGNDADWGKIESGAIQINAYSCRP
jgi:hypothetical protein